MVWFWPLLSLAAMALIWKVCAREVAAGLVNEAMRIGRPWVCGVR
jgi:hypothetical protein